jgi:o-succinylbenzoate synthase
MRVEPFTLPLAHPLSTAHGRIEERQGFLVHVDYGPKTGVGEATPLTGWTESLEECREALTRAPEIAREEDWGVVLSETNVPAARHALSLALADARARRAETPLYRTLADDDRFVPSVPVNATIGDGTPDETATEATDAVERGFDCLKVKVGARPVSEDIDRLRAVREAVGEAVELRADANGAWSRDQAETAFEGVEDLDLAYVEQPLDPEDLDGHAALRGHGTPVALDESLVEYAVETVIAANAADVVVLKPMALGGLDLTRVAAMRARDANVTPVLSNTIDGVAARTGAVHLAASLPGIPACGLATADLLARDLGEDPAPVTDGSIRVPQGNGLGVGDLRAG